MPQVDLGIDHGWAVLSDIHYAEFKVERHPRPTPRDVGDIGFFGIERTGGQWSGFFVVLHTRWPRGQPGSGDELVLGPRSGGQPLTRTPAAVIERDRIADRRVVES